MPERTASPSNQRGVQQPIRGADRNRRDEQSHTATDDVLLPSLDDGLTLLDIDGGRGVSILQSLVLDHLLLHDGPAFWVDANGYATTTTLHSLAPSQRLIERIHIARGFTPYQHYGAVCELPTAVNQAIRRGVDDSATTPSSGADKTDLTPSLIIAPAVDAQYRTDDTLSAAHAATLQARTLARLRRYADAYDAPVLLTRSADDEFTDLVERSADQRLRCERTRMGPRFVGDDFETLVYPVGGGAYYQTTFAYWRQVLDARAAQAGLQPTTATPAPAQHSGVGTGVTTDGETRSFGTDPLLDVWTAASAGGR